MSSALPRVVMTLLVRDEADILNENIAFHLSVGVDHLLVTDNNSLDETPEILGEWAARTGRVSVWTELADTYEQSKWVTKMARAAAIDLGADWVLNADADEFWFPTAGSLPSALSVIPPRVGVVNVRVRDFVARPGGTEGAVRRMIFRYRRSSKVKVAHRAFDDVVVAMGNHSLEFPGVESAPAGRSLSVLHFPVRSYDQFVTKIRNGGGSLANNSTLPESAGFHWRNLYQDLLEERLDERYLEESEVKGLDLAARLIRGRIVPDLRLRRALKGLSRTGA